MSLLVLTAVVLVCLVVALIAIDHLAPAVGGDGRIYGLLKALACAIALVVILQRSGVL